MNEVVIKSEIGSREENQDYAGSLRLGHYLVIAVLDGMGGGRAGGIASEAAFKHIHETILREGINDPIQDIQNVLRSANQHIVELGNNSSDLQGMKTTVCLVIVDKNTLHCGYTGDTRCHVIRNGKIIIRTKDHSKVQDLLDTGQITPGEAENHKKKNIITHALGMNKGFKVDTLKLNLTDGDRVVITTDGVHDTLSGRNLLRRILSSFDPNRSAGSIINAVERKSRGSSQDNYTVAMYQHGSSNPLRFYFNNYKLVFGLAIVAVLLIANFFLWSRVLVSDENGNDDGTPQAIEQVNADEERLEAICRELDSLRKSDDSKREALDREWQNITTGGSHETFDKNCNCISIKYSDYILELYKNLNN